MSKAMDKPVVRDQGTNEEERDIEELAEDDEDTEAVDLIEMIRDGESDVVEFKSTLRTNLYTDKPDKNIEYASLKTLAGFLNTNGGRLVIGISDDGKPVGIEAVSFGTQTKWACI